jgi:hypothetical protein
MTKTEALHDFMEYARDVISPEVVANLISPWTTLKKLGVKPRRIKHFRIIYRPEDAMNWAYAAFDVAVALAESLGMDKYYSPYEGDGRRHEDEMEHAVAFLTKKGTTLPSSS